ncbi:putative quinol monooxygenase [Polaromonas sp. SM01]|uniref:putative quinol monooxygenase n=1 Tax=Polaromonas sp. SM01 TaxID=3085630 RepID=UPI0029822D00|nr:putative quinol monooxygenase [Polaromonas sp. SM01]MDW5442903.1 putative quinol monooxygenase [Polaromonas sp. SM01]
MKTAPLVSLAILEAKTDKKDELRSALQALVPLTRQELGCLDYTLFEQSDSPGTFYMRESFKDRAALDAHFSMPYFQEFAGRSNALLKRPLQLVFLTEVL